MCLRGAGRCCLHCGALGAYSPVIIITQSLQKKNHCEALMHDTSARIIVKDVTAMVVLVAVSMVVTVVEIATDRPRFDSI